MVFSTSAKVAFGVVLTSTAAVGTALTYKYATDFYAIEKLALDSETVWKVKQETSASPNTFTVSVKASSNETLTKKYGVVTTGSWTCKIITTATSTDNLKTQLQTKFGITTNITTSDSDTTASFTQANREGFVNSCSRNRTGTPTKDIVVSEIKLPETSPENKLAEVFNGEWINPKINLSNVNS